jgi:hypothetical protein
MTFIKRVIHVDLYDNLVQRGLVFPSTSELNETSQHNTSDEETQTVLDDTATQGEANSSSEINTSPELLTVGTHICSPYPGWVTFESKFGRFRK